MIHFIRTFFIYVCLRRKDDCYQIGLRLWQNCIHQKQRGKSMVGGCIIPRRGSHLLQLYAFLQKLILILAEPLGFVRTQFKNHCSSYYAKGEMSSGAHLRSLALAGHHSYAETPQRWRAVGDIVFDLTDPGFDPSASRTDSNVFTTEQFGRSIIFTKTLHL